MVVIEDTWSLFRGGLKLRFDCISKMFESFLQNHRQNEGQKEEEKEMKKSTSSRELKYY